MKVHHALACAAVLTAGILPAVSAAQAPPPEGNVVVHDPTVIRQGSTWYVFNTIGKYIGIRTSPDLKTWNDAGAVFAEIPAWAKDAVPGVDGIWAPDISYVDGEYRLYYSVSTFGSNRSAIGLATSPTLDPQAENYGWTDRGMVVMSTPDDDFNAIDPDFIVDAQGRHWLSLGSFWSGIKLFPLDPATGKPLPGAQPTAIARRPAPAGGPAPVEAPTILQRDGAYYLIASYDYCCKGVNSTYYTVIGRADTITGPYRGRDGSEMMQGGGTILIRADLQEKQRYRGPGHADTFTDTDGATTIVWHAYDRQADGAPVLRVAPLQWQGDGWPVVVTTDQ